MSYLEDVENDILTDALNQATLAQVKGHINPDELSSLQDAIRVEEALQQVKTNRYRESRVQIQWGGGGVQIKTNRPTGTERGVQIWWGTCQNQQVPTAGGGNLMGGGGTHQDNRYPQRQWGI